MKTKKWFIALGLLMVFLFVTGCSKEKDNSLALQGLKQEMSSWENTKERRIILEKEVFVPVNEIFLASEKELYPLYSESVPVDLRIAKHGELERKYLQKTKDLALKIPQEDSVSKQEIKLVSAAKMYTQAIEKYLSVDSQVKDTASVGMYEKYYWEYRNLVNAQKYAYEHELDILKGGDGTYQLNWDSFQRIKKGAWYIDAVNTFKMPGKLVIDEKLSGGTEITVYLWAYKDAYVVGKFVNERLVEIKQDGLL